MRMTREEHAKEHGRLLKIVKRDPRDSPQDDPEYRGDCSCGCKFYIELEGSLGMDWGVCTNPKSYRCGLLTFEHQGCLEFVYQPTPCIECKVDDVLDGVRTVRFMPAKKTRTATSSRTHESKEDVMPCMCGDTACPSCGPAQGFDPDFDLLFEYVLERAEQAGLATEGPVAGTRDLDELIRGVLEMLYNDNPDLQDGLIAWARRQHQKYREANR